MTATSGSRVSHKSRFSLVVLLSSTLLIHTLIARRALATPHFDNTDLGEQCLYSTSAARGVESIYMEARIKAETAASVEVQEDGEERCLAKIMRSYGQVGGLVSECTPC
jgi:predicted alpha/beta superfamily hydrolase